MSTSISVLCFLGHLSGHLSVFYRCLLADCGCSCAVYSFRQCPTKKPYYVVDDSLTPEFWFNPCQVWEIRGADLTLSPVHKAGLGYVANHRDSGVSLRFPRFVRVRDDKAVEDATTSKQVADMFAMQFVRAGAARPADDVDAEADDASGSDVEKNRPSAATADEDF